VRRDPTRCKLPSRRASMLKGSRLGIVKRLQPISVHGQISLDVFWVDPEDPEEEIRHSRVGNESVPRDLEPGDRVEMHYLMGMVTQITRS
jgi:hypothetical protein